MLNLSFSGWSARRDFKVDSMSSRRMRFPSESQQQVRTGVADRHIALVSSHLVYRTTSTEELNSGAVSELVSLGMRDGNDQTVPVEANVVHGETMTWTAATGHQLAHPEVAEEGNGEAAPIRRSIGTGHGRIMNAVL